MQVLVLRGDQGFCRNLHVMLVRFLCCFEGASRMHVQDTLCECAKLDYLCKKKLFFFLLFFLFDCFFKWVNYVKYVIFFSLVIPFIPNLFQLSCHKMQQTTDNCKERTSSRWSNTQSTVICKWDTRGHHRGSPSFSVHLCLLDSNTYSPRRTIVLSSFLRLCPPGHPSICPLCLYPPVPAFCLHVGG